MSSSGSLILVDRIATQIIHLRGQRIILDRDLAVLYGVTTGAFNRAVKRNIDRFPDDFMFQLTDAEQSELASTVAHLKQIKFSKSPPHAFTEHGAIWLPAC